jgi:pimeloyl-ACP methyl ester carboxylesterase
MRRALWLVLPALALSLNSVRGQPAVDSLDRAPSKFAKSGDLKVHYKSLGEGKTAVVFVHGWCCDHSVWRDQAAGFDGLVRMLFVDLPGYGQSDKPKIDYTMDVFAKGVDAVLRDAGVEQAVPVGHSMGTPVVMKFYRLFPAKTKALVFVDGALRPFTRDPAQTEQFLSRFKEETFKDSSSQMFNGMLTPATPDAARKQLQQIVANTSPQVAISSMRNMFDPNQWKDEGSIRAPAQALMAKSPNWNQDYKDYAKQFVPGLDYREFDGVGHFLFMEKPKEFNDALAEFLKKQGVMK